MAGAKHVVIVGGGFSGAATAIQLVRKSRGNSLKVTLLNPLPDFGRGLAYRHDDDNLLLNVPAGNMSALADEPEHFVLFCAKVDPSFSAGSFVSRRLYGNYMEDTLAQAGAQVPGVIQTRAGEAVSIERAERQPGWTVTLKDGQELVADHVVLATGHQDPVFPVPADSEAKARILLPDDTSETNRLPPGGQVVVMGTGHTAVEALFRLCAGCRLRQVVMLSRHGLLPHAHRPLPLPPGHGAFPEYLEQLPVTARGYANVFRQHARRLADQGTDWRDALNGLRPHTPQIWQSLPVAEKRRFLRHLRAYWEVHRHRLAPVAAHRLNTLLHTGQVEILAGRLLSARGHAEGVELEVRPRGSDITEVLRASAVVNCTGPNGNALAGPPLLARLIQAGLLQGDDLGLGLRVSSQYQPLDASGQPVGGLWYIGPMLKADFWEATAVPELRVHAQKLAQALLDG